MSVFVAESERLWLQSLDVEQHLQDYFEMMSDPAAMLWSSSQLAHTDLQQTLDLMLKSMPTSAQPWNKRWAIMLRPVSQVPAPKNHESQLKVEKTNSETIPKMIGIIGTPRKGDLAYKLSPQYWGKGYMSEAVSMFLRMWWEMQENRDYTELIAAADPRNVGSMRVLKKAGFKEIEGGYKVGFYQRAVDDCVKSDLQFFHLERPSL